MQGTRRNPAHPGADLRASAGRPGPPRRARGPGRHRGDRSRRAAPVSPLRAACTAVATANTDAPAPPRPPTTASTAPSPPPPSTACASAATSQGSASGSEITCSAPTATACFHASGGGSPETATMTPARRGSPAAAHARADDGVEHDDRSARPAPAGLGGVECAHDLAPGRRGRPEHGVEQSASDTITSPRRPLVRRRRRSLVACSPCRRPRTCASPSPSGPPRAARQAWGRAGPSGPTSWSAVDGAGRMWTTRRFRRAARCASVGCGRMEVPCLRGGTHIPQSLAGQPMREPYAARRREERSAPRGTNWTAPVRGD